MDKQRCFVRQKEFWKYYLAEAEAWKLLSYNIDPKERVNLFKKFVFVINIETSSYCNRKCDYCPVHLLKGKQYDYLADFLYESIVEQLADMRYEGNISLNLFNEPLLDPDIIEKIKFLKLNVPRSFVHLNSNGDFLNKDLLIQLEEAGVEEMIVTAHLLNGEKYDDSDRKEAIKKIFDRIGIKMSITHYIPGRNITCMTNFGNMNLYIVANNWREYGCDRGGTLDQLKRESQTKPCMVPFREMVIAHDGKVRGCFNIFTSENNYGDVSKASLVDIYFSNRMVELRRELLVFGNKKRPHDSCSTPDIYIDNDETKIQRENILRQALNG